MDIKNKINHIDHIVYINLDRDENRNNYMIEQLCTVDVPYTRISAIDGETYKPDKKNKKLLKPKYMTKYEIACTLSHVKAINYLSNIGGEYFLVLEDDVTFDNCLLMKETLKDIIVEAPKFDILQIYKTYEKVLDNKYVSWKDIRMSSKSIFGTAAYIISREGINNFCKLSKYVESENSFMIEKQISVADIFIYKYVNTVIYKYNFIDTLNNNSTIHTNHLSLHIRSSKFQLEQIHKYINMIDVPA